MDTITIWVLKEDLSNIASGKKPISYWEEKPKYRDDLVEAVVKVETVKSWNVSGKKLLCD